MVAVGDSYVVRSFYLLCLHFFMVCDGDSRGMGFFCVSPLILFWEERGGIFIFTKEVLAKRAPSAPDYFKTNHFLNI